MAADSKAANMNILVSTITASVDDVFTPKIEELATQLAKMSVVQATILARLEMLGSVGGAAVAAKREVRPAGTASATKKAAATAGGAKAAGDKAPIGNALLYFRYMMRDDGERYRETYATPEAIADIEAGANGDKLSKHTRESPEWWSALGGFLWKTLDEAAQAEVKHHREAYNAALASGGERPLDEGDE